MPHVAVEESPMSRRITRSQSRLSALCALVGGLALIVAGCSGDAVSEDATDTADSSAYIEPDHAGSLGCGCAQRVGRRTGTGRGRVQLRCGERGGYAQGGLLGLDCA